jgi:hypothetical protein
MTTGVVESITSTTKTLNCILCKPYLILIDALSILVCSTARLEAQFLVFPYPTGPRVCPL